MGSHLIYHPQRRVSQFDNVYVHFDATGGNQDPYVWNPRFLHTFCHATELRRPVIDDIMFWVSSERFDGFEQLFCDLVFIVDEVCRWQTANSIDRGDAIVDSDEAYIDHYRWASWQHCFKTRRRRTLKAHPTLSFQPQQADGRLIDIVPFLANHGVAIEALREGLKKGNRSKPMPIDTDVAEALLADIRSAASILLLGDQLATIRHERPGLASPDPTSRPKCLEV